MQAQAYRSKQAEQDKRLDAVDLQQTLRGDQAPDFAETADHLAHKTSHNARRLSAGNAWVDASYK